MTPRPKLSDDAAGTPADSNLDRGAGADVGTSTHFGFRTVPEAEKAGLVSDVFAKVAGRYDLMNDVMSGGLHRAWKQAMIDWLNPPRRGTRFDHLDVAGGTGDIAFRLLERTGGTASGARVTVCDINPAMLDVGRQRAAAREDGNLVDFVCGDAEQLGFPDARFDAYTIAFGIRNVTHIDRALNEAYRVLKPGGRFLCLEFSHVDIPGLDTLYDAYSFRAIPAIGKAVTGDGAPYQYLVESIRRFPDRERFQEMVEAAGFGRASYRVLTGGIAALHSAWRL